MDMIGAIGIAWTFGLLGLLVAREIVGSLGRPGWERWLRPITWLITGVVIVSVGAAILRLIMLSIPG